MIFLLSHFHHMPCKQLWMKAGTAKRRKYIPVHEIIAQLPFGSTVLEILPSFHALIGSDSTSFMLGHGKKTAWKVLKQHHERLCSLRRDDLTEKTVRDAELFVCKLYKIQNVAIMGKAHVILLAKCRAPDTLPPTSNALLLHVEHCH